MPRRYAKVHRFRDLVKKGCETLTRDALAASCHVSRRTVGYWLVGSVPHRGTLASIERAIARAAGVTIDEVRACVEHERAGYVAEDAAEVVRP